MARQRDKSLIGRSAKVPTRRFVFRNDGSADRSRDSVTTSSSSGKRSFVSSAKALKHSFSESGSDGDNIASIDAMREFLISWQLEEFVAKNAELLYVLQDLSSEQAVALATLYLFLLARERGRHPSSLEHDAVVARTIASKICALARWDESGSFGKNAARLCRIRPVRCTRRFGTELTTRSTLT